jgi:hypothetical protein
VNQRLSPIFHFLVCDKLASECKNWSSTTFSADDHCHASDKGSSGLFYKNLRESLKRGRTITPTPPGTSGTILERLLRDAAAHEVDRLVNNVSSPRAYSGASNLIAKGPFKPDDVTAKKNKMLTKCRKCHYYNKFDHQNFTKVVQGAIKAYRTCPQDWCHACGRVASVKDFEKEKSVKYNVDVGDILLGTKTIPFTVKAHDPRKFEDVSKYWKENEGSPKWVYDEAEMENDFFRHRIGKQPTLAYILTSIPVTEDDSIPQEGKLQQSYSWNSSSGGKPSLSETEALLLENKSDLKLLREMYSFTYSEPDTLGLTLTAQWNKTQQKGVSIS